MRKGTIRAFGTEAHDNKPGSLDAYPRVAMPCTHCHVASVVFEDGTMFKAFERCDSSPIPNDTLVRRARRLWAELQGELAPFIPEPDVLDIVRYTREVPRS